MMDDLRREPVLSQIFHGGVDNVVVAEKVEGGIHIVTVDRQPLNSHALRPEDVKHDRDVYVQVDSWTDALLRVRDHGVVGLRGESGSGRWITAVNLAVEMKLSPRLLDFDPDDRPLVIKPGSCYLIDLATVGDLASPALGAKLSGYADELKGAGSRLLIVATGPLWASCGLTELTARADIASVDPLDVFRAHLAVMQSQGLAESWAALDATAQALDKVTAADAVWLASLVDAAVGRGLEQEAARAEVFSAYRNWPDVLKMWFDKTNGPEHGYRRALAFAVAVLEGCPAGMVFAAADVLAAKAKVVQAPGAGLLGPGAQSLLASVEAELDDGRVRFRRIGYGTALLDSMWGDRHQLRAQTLDWWADAPRKRGVGADAAWALAVARLANQHRDPELAIEVAKKWATGDNTYSLARQLLSGAAIADETGRVVRRRLYEWASRNEGASWHELTADVCSGEMGRLFTATALTRLRHLAVSDQDGVRKKVVTALTTLAAEPPARPEVIREIADWTASTVKSRAAAGRQAYLALAQTAGDKSLPVLAAMLDSPDEAALLADCWWRVLRDSDSCNAARAEFLRWLDAAIEGRLPFDGALDCLAGACRSAIDAGDLGFILQGWAEPSADATSTSARRPEVFAELSRRAADKGTSSAQKATLEMSTQFLAGMPEPDPTHGI